MESAPVIEVSSLALGVVISVMVVSCAIAALVWVDYQVPELPEQMLVCEASARRSQS